jgi:hypothetical protein
MELYRAPRNNPCNYSHQILDKVPKTQVAENTASLTNDAEKTRYLYVED